MFLLGLVFAGNVVIAADKQGDVKQLVNKKLGDKRLKVATTFTIIADLAENVAGDAADVVSITRPGAGNSQLSTDPERSVARARC